MLSSLDEVFSWRRFGLVVDVVPVKEQAWVAGRNYDSFDFTMYRTWLIANVEFSAWSLDTIHRDGAFKGYRFRFKDENDAVMFKLTFSEQLLK